MGHPLPALLSTLLSGAVTGALAVIGVVIARWKVEALQRSELQAALNERRAYVKDLEDRNASLYEATKQIEATAAENNRRIDMLEMQLRDQRDQMVEMTSERLRRDRYIRTLCACLRSNKIDVPMFPEERRDDRG